MKTPFLRLCLLLAPLGLFATAPDITYPGDGFAIDITAEPYNADPTGNEDISAALEAASVDARNRSVPFMVYFPNGVYRMDNPAVLSDRTQGGGFIMLQGQSRQGVVLQIPPETPSFGDAEDPQAMISYFEGEWTNNGFTNVFENFTIEVGAGNPGAIGLRFQGNNTTHLRNVTIRSLDPEGAGAIGLDLSPSISAPAIAENFRVEGFAIGVALDNPTTGAQTWTLKDVELQGQTEAGIQTHRKPLAVQNLHSINAVPVINSLYRDGSIVVIGGQWEVPQGKDPQGPAVLGQGDFFYLRDVTASGYDFLIRDEGAATPATGEPQTFRNGPVYKAWEDSVESFLHLPATPFPTIEHDPPADWFIVDPTLQEDDTEALRKAMLSGAETIFLKPTGQFQVDGTIDIGPNVKRITSNFAEIVQNVPLSFSGGSVFRLGNSNHPAVVIERLAADWQQNLNEYFIHNASNADLVLQDILWNSGAVYRNDPAGGRLFLKNVHNVPGGQRIRHDYPGWIIHQQETVAYQFNPEMTLPMLTVDGGSFRVLGFKFGEQQGPAVRARNHAEVEMLGGMMNVTHGDPFEPEDTPIFDIENAEVTANLVERAKEILGPPKWDYRHLYIARETRGTETRELPTTAPEIIHRDTLSNSGPGNGGAMVPFFTSAQPHNPANQPPAVSVYASRHSSLQSPTQLLAEVTDPDTHAARLSVHWSKISGPGWVDFANPSAVRTSARFQRAGTYQLSATAADGDGSSSDTLTVTVHPGAASLVPERRGFIRLIDNAPRDGEGDFAIEGLFLQTGDIAGNAGESEVRMQMELAIDAFHGTAGQLAAAHLRLSPKTLTNPLDVEVWEVTENVFGRAAAAEFQASGQSLATIPATSLTADAPVELDVTDVIRRKIAAGDWYAGFSLRSTPNDNGQDNWVEWHPTYASDPSLRPRIVLRFKDAVEPSPWDRAIDLETGRLLSASAGEITPHSRHWVFSHSWNQWLYASPTTEEALWLWSPQEGWYWSPGLASPVLYHKDSASWQYAYPTADSVFFYDFKARQWLP